MHARQTLQCEPTAHTPPSPLPVLLLLIPQPTHRPWGCGSCAPPSPPPCCAAQQCPAAPRPRAPQTAAAAPPPGPTAGAAGPPQKRPAAEQGGASVGWGGVCPGSKWDSIVGAEQTPKRLQTATHAAAAAWGGACSSRLELPLAPNTSTTPAAAAEANAAAANAKLPPDRAPQSRAESTKQRAREGAEAAHLGIAEGDALRHLSRKGLQRSCQPLLLQARSLQGAAQHGTAWVGRRWR